MMSCQSTEDIFKELFLQNPAYHIARPHTTYEILDSNFELITVLNADGSYVNKRSIYLTIFILCYLLIPILQIMKRILDIISPNKT
jgi:hypothetical protein